MFFSTENSNTFVGDCANCELSDFTSKYQGLLGLILKKQLELSQ